MFGLRRKAVGPCRAAQPAPPTKRWRAEIGTDVSEDHPLESEVRVHDSDIEDRDEGGSSDGSDDEGGGSEESAAELARWCRCQVREGGPGAAACRNALSAAAHGSSSSCPHRLLHELSSSDTGRGFLRSCGHIFCAQILVVRARSGTHRAASKDDGYREVLR